MFAVAPLNETKKKEKRERKKTILIHFFTRRRVIALNDSLRKLNNHFLSVALIWNSHARMCWMWRAISLIPFTENPTLFAKFFWNYCRTLTVYLATIVFSESQFWICKQKVVSPQKRRSEEKKVPRHSRNRCRKAHVNFQQITSSNVQIKLAISTTFGHLLTVLLALLQRKKYVPHGCAKPVAPPTHWSTASSTAGGFMGCVRRWAVLVHRIFYFATSIVFKLKSEHNEKAVTNSKPKIYRAGNLNAPKSGDLGDAWHCVMGSAFNMRSKFKRAVFWREIQEWMKFDQHRHGPSQTDFNFELLVNRGKAKTTVDAFENPTTSELTNVATAIHPYNNRKRIPHTLAVGSRRFH